MNCHVCEVRWAGDGPCWSCGRPGVREALRVRLTASKETRNPQVLRMADDGHVEGWERRAPWAVWVREQLAARLPWLRLEAGAVESSYGLTLLCVLGIVLVLGWAVIWR